MAISTGIGSAVYIAAATTGRVATAYPSLTWVEIGKVESFGEFGDTDGESKFTPLKDGRTRTLKAATDPGGITIKYADDPLDLGQIALIAAKADRSALVYPIKIVSADGADANDTDTTTYFGVRVLSIKPSKGETGVSMRSAVCAIDTPFHEIASVAVS
tara:strand:+ start:3536 stop:4012 length:477 start_codon:yes stop_codon:yes gene_type:complete